MPTRRANEVPIPESTDAAAALGRAFAAAMEEILGSRTPKAGTIVSTLGVSRNLAWRLQQMALPDDLPATLHAMVGEVGFERLMSGFRAAETSGRRLEEIQRRWDELKVAMRRDQFDRETLRTIGAQMHSPSRGRVDVARARRDAVRASATLLGVGMSSMVQLQMFAPSPGRSIDREDDRVGLAAASFLGGIRVVRPVAPLVIYGQICRADDDRLDGGTIGDRPTQWIDSICSRGVRGTAVRPHASRKDLLILDSALLPRSTPIDLAFTETLHDFASPWADEPGDTGSMTAAVGYPIDRMILYLGTHASMPPWTRHTCHVRTALSTSMRLPPERQITTIPIEARVEPVALRDGVPELPQGSRTLAHAVRTIVATHAESLGHAAEDFRFQRVVIDHPPLKTLISMRWHLADRSA